jgi:hypothetical protein
MSVVDFSASSVPPRIDCDVPSLRSIKNEAKSKYKRKTITLQATNDSEFTLSIKDSSGSPSSLIVNPCEEFSIQFSVVKAKDEPMDDPNEPRKVRLPVPVTIEKQQHKHSGNSTSATLVLESTLSEFYVSVLDDSIPLICTVKRLRGS